MSERYWFYAALLGVYSIGWALGATVGGMPWASGGLAVIAAGGLDGRRGLADPAPRRLLGAAVRSPSSPCGKT